MCIRDRSEAQHRETKRDIQEISSQRHNTQRQTETYRRYAVRGTTQRDKRRHTGDKQSEAQHRETKGDIQEISSQRHNTEAKGDIQGHNTDRKGRR